MAYRGFQTAGFPKTVCAVDGCHIPTHCNNPVAYYKRKQFYSVILTGFCDSELRFCHVNIGHLVVGMIPEHFAKQMLHGYWKKIPRPEGMHIIGDSAYPLSQKLMKPYRVNGHLTARQRRFHKKLNAAHVAVEHAFGILKSKFMSLKCKHMKKVPNISETVTACCILHNICLVSGDQLDEDEQGLLHQLREDIDDSHPPQPNNQDASHYRYMIWADI